MSAPAKLSTRAARPMRASPTCAQIQPLAAEGGSAIVRSPVGSRSPSTRTTGSTNTPRTRSSERRAAQSCHATTAQITTDTPSASVRTGGRPVSAQRIARDTVWQTQPAPQSVSAIPASRSRRPGRAITAASAARMYPVSATSKSTAFIRRRSLHEVRERRRRAPVALLRRAEVEVGRAPVLDECGARGVRAPGAVDALEVAAALPAALDEMAGVDLVGEQRHEDVGLAPLAEGTAAGRRRPRAAAEVAGVTAPAVGGDLGVGGRPTTPR